MADGKHTWAMGEPSEVPWRALPSPITTPRSPVSLFVPRQRSNGPEDAEKPPPVRRNPAVPAYTSYNATRRRATARRLISQDLKVGCTRRPRRAADVVVPRNYAPTRPLANHTLAA